jgi:hypothetical protein
VLKERPEGEDPMVTLTLKLAVTVAGPVTLIVVEALFAFCTLAPVQLANT